MSGAESSYAAASPCLALFLAVAALHTLSLRDRDELRGGGNGDGGGGGGGGDGGGGEDEVSDLDEHIGFLHRRRVRGRLSVGSAGAWSSLGGGSSLAPAHAAPHDHFQNSASMTSPQRRRHVSIADAPPEEIGWRPSWVNRSFQFMQSVASMDRTSTHTSHFESDAEGEGAVSAVAASVRSLLGVGGEQSHTAQRPSDKPKGSPQGPFCIFGGDEMDDDEAGGGASVIPTAAGAASPMRGRGKSPRAGRAGGKGRATEAEDKTKGVDSSVASSSDAGDIADEVCGVSSSQLPPPPSTSTFPPAARRRSSAPGAPTRSVRAAAALRRSSSDVTAVSGWGPAARLEAARSDYNARIMPARVVMVRHGQSEGNVAEGLYATKPDNAMRLTRLGWDQARNAGRILRERVLKTTGDGGAGGAGTVHFIVSPYVRTVETFHGIASAWCDPAEFDHIPDERQRIKAWYGRLIEMGLSWHEDPRIREQDFGNYQDPETIKKCKGERHKFGPFYYRFPHGESASDVFDRVSTFLDSLWRSFELQKAQNYVLVTHGISIRVLLARYFRYSIDQFNMLANPKNCEMVMLGHDGAGKLRLNGRCELKLQTSPTDSEDEDEDGDRYPQVVGYQFHDRLRILPKKWIEKRTIRLTYDG